MRPHGIACPLCGRTVQGSPGDPIPEHLDETFGTPCLASGWTFESFLAHHEEVEVPRWPSHNGSPPSIQHGQTAGTDDGDGSSGERHH